MAARAWHPTQVVDTWYTAYGTREPWHRAESQIYSLDVGGKGGGARAGLCGFICLHAAMGALGARMGSVDLRVPHGRAWHAMRAFAYAHMEPWELRLAVEDWYSANGIERLLAMPCPTKRGNVAARASKHRWMSQHELGVLAWGLDVTVLVLWKTAPVGRYHTCVNHQVDTQYVDAAGATRESPFGYTRKRTMGVLVLLYDGEHYQLGGLLDDSGQGEPVAFFRHDHPVAAALEALSPRMPCCGETRPTPAECTPFADAVTYLQGLPRH